MNNHPLGPATVLIVEDDALIRMEAVRTVEEQGYLALSACNAEEAVAGLAAHAEIDVLFTDINMPGLMDGLELAKSTRRDRPAMEIVIASGNLPPLANLPLRSRYLQKPYRQQEVISALFALIDQTRPYAC